jgi:hypothetical protein
MTIEDLVPGKKKVHPGGGDRNCPPGEHAEERDPPRVLEGPRDDGGSVEGNPGDPDDRDQHQGAVALQVIDTPGLRIDLREKTLDHPGAPGKEVADLEDADQNGGGHR